jgi:hypothetical protein
LRNLREADKTLGVLTKKATYPGREGRKDEVENCKDDIGNILNSLITCCNKAGRLWN